MSQDRRIDQLTALAASDFASTLKVPAYLSGTKSVAGDVLAGGLSRQHGVHVVSDPAYNGDVQAAIDAATAQGGGYVKGKPGDTYTVASITLGSGVVLDMTGCTVVKDGGAVSTHIINVTGSTTATTATLTADVAVAVTALTAAAFTGFAAGDWVLLRDATYVSGSAGRNQEINRVESVAAGTLTLRNRTIGSYATASSAEVVKITPCTDARIVGGTYQLASGTSGGGLFADLAVGFRVRDVVVEGPRDDGGIQIERSAYGSVIGCTVRNGQNLSTGGYAYGIAVGESSHHISVLGNHTHQVRENLLTNRARFITFVGNTMNGHYDTGVNTHGAGVSHCVIANNTVSSPRGSGITVGFSSHTAGDSHIIVSGNVIRMAGGSGISVAAPSGKANDGIVVANNVVDGYGVEASFGSQSGINLSYSDNCLISGNSIVGQAGTATDANGIFVANATNTEVLGNRIGANSGYGITWSTATGLRIRHNQIAGVSSQRVRALGTNSGVVLSSNTADSTSRTLDGTERLDGNQWGTKYDRDRGATAAVADGGTITHACVATPTHVRVTGSVAGEIVSVTALGASTFTVAIKKTDGSAGTAQTIYWEAEV